MVDDDYMLDLLERAAPVPPSADDALDALRPRIRRARRRRAAMRGSAGLVVLVVMGGLVAQTTTDQTSREVRVGGSDTTASIESTTTSDAPSTTIATDEAEDAAPPSTVAVDPGDAFGAAESGGTGRASAAAPAGAAPSSVAPARPSSTQSAPNRSSASRPAAPKPAAPAPAGGGTTSGSTQVTTFESEAGKVEITYTDTAMSLESVSPLPGWSVGTTDTTEGSIQVTFEPDSGDGTAVDVEVHLDGGVPVVGAAEDTVEETVEGASDAVDVMAGS